MRTTWLTYLIFELNAVIDTGQHQDIGMSEVKEHIEAGDILPWLKTRLGGDIDLSFLLGEGDTEAREAITGGLQQILGGYGGKERRKWGVENSGLCLLVAWAAELIQQNRKG